MSEKTIKKTLRKVKGRWLVVAASMIMLCGFAKAAPMLITNPYQWSRADTQILAGELPISSGLTLNPGWTFLQDTPFDAGCSAGSATCTLNSILSTTSGSAWVFWVNHDTNTTIQNMSGGSATWNYFGNGFTSCHIFDGTHGQDSDCAYATNGASSTTSVTVTLGVAPAFGWAVKFAEVLPPAGYSALLDTAGVNSSSSCGICNGVSLNLTATDAVFSFAAPWNGPPTTSTGNWHIYSDPFITDVNFNGVYLNAPAGTLAAPTFPNSPADSMVVSSIAFKSTAGKFNIIPSVFNMVNISYYPSSIDCTPTCSVTIPTTGANNLLILEQANQNTQHITAVSDGTSSFSVPSGSNTCTQSVSGASQFVIGCAYLLASNASKTTVNVTMNTTGFVGFVVYEISRNDGKAFVLDAQGSSQVSPTGGRLTGQSLALGCTGCSNSITGTNDVLIGTVFTQGGSNAPTLYPYFYNTTGDQDNLQAANALTTALLNTTNGNPSIWVSGGGSNGAVSSIAFK